MGTPSNPQQEPSMEEILASIRKIISEDQPESGANEVEEGAVVEAQESSEPEVLELTQKAEGESAPSGEKESEHETVPQFDADSEQREAGLREEGQPAIEDDDLISDSTRHAVDQALREIESVPERAPPVPTHGNIEEIFARAVQNALDPTLNDWVDGHADEIMERLKPLIREWMDDNLPPLIETAVQREISRAVKARKR